jgi:hypothetical protein
VLDVEEFLSAAERVTKGGSVLDLVETEDINRRVLAVLAHLAAHER